MRYQTALKLKQKRPRSLDDPYGEYPEEVLRALLATPDSNYSWRDYRTLLGPHLHVGTYQESVYFLPLAYDHLWDNDEDALDLCDSVGWFISEYNDELANDKLLEACRSRVRELLWKWVSRFKVDHYDRNACKAKGWVLDYDDIVPLRATLCEFSGRLLEFGTHEDLVIGFFERLGGSLGSVDQAAWFLELWRAQGDVYHPPSHERITALLNNADHLRAAVYTLQDSELVTQSESPTYWVNMFASLRGIV